MNLVLVCLLAVFCFAAEAKDAGQVLQAGASAETEYILVTGEVNQPTKIRSDRRIKLTQLIAFCGGLTSQADEGRIIIIGQKGIEVFDLRRVRNSSREPFVYPGDIVRVRNH